ncbi:leucyl/phenylalanyl-tRNA--protein transferase [Clostridium sp. MSJ-8]|uniref:leucyl/phenylalanyl-tRNA--protein transferase n=1 Tax=Clostridium sp. MSJ-8 TaxID=2841510 RepID=UPI001C0E900F|nr:leucyl/phenylalanyl-tRNA--protein transferase [Clostridium sp. MSJ-8]MBU5488720.1 leucyl/phenylalanyl-tRNA--protein transferase [Clostridium sp. MSJ-8]
MSIFRLSEEIVFPDPHLAEDDGLLAIGGDLSVDRLLEAYVNGIFPWYNEGDPIMWWSPKPRCILLPQEIKVSKSMAKIIKKDMFNVTIDNDFEGVISNCQSMRKEEGTWITEEMKNAYIRLHNAGYALSVESYLEGELVGGLYGVVIGRCFFGESMFSKVSNASKIALIKLARILEKNKFEFIDCQMKTDHLISMGAKMIEFDEFLKLIDKGLS